MSKTYTFDEIYMIFNVAYTIKDDRNTMPSFEIIAKTIDKALILAKKKLATLVNKDDEPIITSIDFVDYVNSKGDVLCCDRDGETWERMEDWEEECEKKAEERLRKEKEKPIDTSCWYIDPSNVNARVFNQNGDKVELNTFQSNDDYKYFQELHLNQDNTHTEFGVTRYTSVCPMIYECIVYGHNYRYGYIKNKTNSLTEAILRIRVHYTKLSKDDDPRKEQG